MIINPRYATQERERAPETAKAAFCDEVSGLRYYNPATGRWLSRDPIGEEGGVNLFAFIRNNPLCHVDSHGLEGEPEPISSWPPGPNELDMPDEPERTEDEGPKTCPLCQKLAKVREIRVYQQTHGILMFFLGLRREDVDTTMRNRFLIRINIYKCVESNAIVLPPSLTDEYNYDQQSWTTGHWYSISETTSIIRLNYNVIPVIRLEPDPHPTVHIDFSPPMVHVDLGPKP